MDLNEKEITLTSEIILNDYYDDGDQNRFNETNVRSSRKINSIRIKIKKKRLKEVLEIGDVVTIDYFTVEEHNVPKQKSITSQINKERSTSTADKIKVDAFNADKIKRKTNSERDNKFLNDLYTKLESKRKLQEEEKKPKEYKISIFIKISDELKNEEKTFKINRIENVVDNIKDIAKTILHYSLNNRMLTNADEEKQQETMYGSNLFSESKMKQDSLDKSTLKIIDEAISKFNQKRDNGIEYNNKVNTFRILIKWDYR